VPGDEVEGDLFEAGTELAVWANDLVVAAADGVDHERGDLLHVVQIWAGEKLFTAAFE